MIQKNKKTIIIFLIITSIVALITSIAGLIIALKSDSNNYVVNVSIIIMAIGLCLYTASMMWPNIHNKLIIVANLCFAISFIGSAFITKGVVGMILVLFALIILISTYFALTKSSKIGILLIVFVVVAWF